MADTVTGAEIKRKFCTREDNTALTAKDEEWNWPYGPGGYCIYRKGGECPKGR